ncbi:hypothetical protein K2173_027522 [Erythroxylum novogranatense]|uniref:Uncharacterized protein n=1 Tax=Erythroxylum novogranatense TaxID=1862640 RepID=A0AAV8TZF7_9ROSI|nr:hypothetical protein K2173_027522 [Erythroxylum novogranatense]
MFGGGGGGNTLLKVVGRTVARAGVTNLQEPISSNSVAATSPRSTHKPSSSNNSLSLCHGPDSGSSPFFASGVPVCGYSRGPNLSHWSSVSYDGGSCSDEYEWASEAGDGLVDDFYLGPVPSAEEVHDAVSALQMVIKDKLAIELEKDTEEQNSIPTAESELDWAEPSIYMYSSRAPSPYGPSRVYDAFRMLQTDPSVQQMVISLSSDKAVWDAILNNEMVQVLRNTYHADEAGRPNSESSSNPAMGAIEWIFENTKARVMRIAEKMLQLVNQLLKPNDKKIKEGSTIDPFEEKLRSSFMLCLMVLLVVVVTRGHGP